MNDKLIEIIVSQGIWTVLSFILIFYIIKTQEKRDIQQDKREKKYQQILNELSKNFELIREDIKDLKEEIKK